MIPVGVGEIYGCRIEAVGKESLQIRTIIIVIAGLRYCGAIENDGTLTEERVEEIIDDARVDRNDHIIPRTLD